MQFIRTKAGILKGNWSQQEASVLAHSVRGQSVADELRNDIAVFGDLTLGFDAIRDKVAREQFPDKIGMVIHVPWREVQMLPAEMIA